MADNGILVTGNRARSYDYRGTLWSRIKAKHLSLINPRPKQRVLDVGCGTGKTLLFLRQKCDKSVELYGIEPSKDMLKRAKSQLASEAHLQQAIAQHLPYPDNFFDFAISTQVMHHLSSADKKRMLSEMYRVLKPGSTVVVSDWGKPTNLLGKFISFLWRNHAYVKQNNRYLTLKTFRRAGFRQNKQSIQFGIVHHISGTK